MNIFKEIFSENSEISIMRVMAVTSLIIGAVLAFKGMDTSVYIFVGAAFAGKVTQKFIESKEE